MPVTSRATRATNNSVTLSVEVDWNEWFKRSALVPRLCCADEHKIQKIKRAHLIKSFLCGNYLMKTFALKRLDFQQSRNWQKESCLFSKCLQQENSTRQTIEGGRGPDRHAEHCVINSLSTETVTQQLKVFQATSSPALNALCYVGVNMISGKNLGRWPSFRSKSSFQDVFTGTGCDPQQWFWDK